MWKDNNFPRDFEQHKCKLCQNISKLYEPETNNVQMAITKGGWQGSYTCFVVFGWGDCEGGSSKVKIRFSVYTKPRGSIISSIFYMYGCFACIYVCALCVCLQRLVTTAISSVVGVGNWTRVIWKSSHCSEQLS